MLMGCFKTFLSNFCSENNLRKKIHIAKKINGSVGKVIFIGVPDINSDNSSDSGVKNNIMSNSLSNARNARKKRTRTKGISVTIKESLYNPNILAIMYKIASMYIVMIVFFSENTIILVLVSFLLLYDGSF